MREPESRWLAVAGLWPDAEEQALPINNYWLLL
jgi:hypothetical protein